MKIKCFCLSISLGVLSLSLSSWAFGKAANHHKGLFSYTSFEPHREDLPADARHLWDLFIAPIPEETVQLYKKIAAYQTQERFYDADALIRRLKDTSLMSDILLQRFLSPSYRASYKELAAWLEKQPQSIYAPTIYALARRKAPKGAAVPYPQAYKDIMLFFRTPKAPEFKGDDRQHPIVWNVEKSRQAQRRIFSLMGRYSSSGSTLSMRRLLEDKHTEKILSRAEYGRMEGYLAKSYYLDGEYERALWWGKKALGSDSYQAPQAQLYAAFASFRLGNFAQAKDLFCKAARRGDVSGQFLSETSYWCASAAMAVNDTATFFKALEQAASWPYTFYGLIAAATLGVAPDLSWELPEASSEDLRSLATLPEVHRAALLLRLGAFYKAGHELLGAYPYASAAQRRGLAALLAAFETGDAQAILGEYLRLTKGVAYNRLLFPSPPIHGIDEDMQIPPQLLYAIIRQESHFRVEANSDVGARGLMQIMPATARLVDRDYRKNTVDKLVVPSMNIKLGQRYVHYLSDSPYVDNIISLLTAWNAGPANLLYWRRSSGYTDNPLLFISSIKSPQTRDFVGLVMRNMWIYQFRFEGRFSPNLLQLSSMQWPTSMTRVALFEPKNPAAAEKVKNSIDF